MAVDLEIGTKVDFSGLESQLDQVIKRLENVEGDMKGISKQTEDIGKSAKASAKGTNSLAAGFKGVGLAIKAAGIGILLSILGTLQELFMQNSKITKIFTTIFEAFSIVVNDFVNFISSEGALSSVGNFFKNLIENPSLTIAKLTVDMQKYTESTVDAAGALSDLTDQMIINQAQADQTIQKYERQAELQRQIRDNEEKTFAERIAANNELLRLLEEQGKVERDLAQDAIKAAELRLQSDPSNPTLIAEKINAQTKLFEIENRLESQRSEQLVNQVSLRRELNEFIKENERQQVEELEKIQSRGATDIENEPRVVRARKVNEVLLGLEKDLAMNVSKQTKVKTNYERQLAKDKIAIAENAAGALSMLLDQGSKEAKALASAQVLFDTYRGIQSAFATGSANVSATTATFGAWPFIQAAAAATFGFANLAAINSAPTKGGSGVSAPSFSGGGAPAPEQSGLPDFRFANQGVGGTEGADFGASRSYIVLQDLRNKESLDERIRDSSRLG